tara:strand:- start:209 stop:646 length:438 start_codon:yes stop_codon:yes gene_type:complete
MKIIAHRGLMVGPNPEHENQPDTIDEALSHGFDVEVDVRLIKGELLLGHDDRTSVCPTWLYDDTRVWFHAKNTDALVYLNTRGKRVFYHTEEDVVMTSKGELWALPGKGFKGSYIVLPENSKELIPEGALGICTDYAIKYRKKYS